MRDFKNIIGGCVKASSVFCWEVNELVRTYSDKKQRFDPSIIAGAVRCRHGRVQVLVCKPFGRNGRPFPTTFWLVCPYLCRLAGTLEAQQGVHELEGYMRSKSLGREWRAYTLRHQAIRLGLLEERTRSFMRKYRPGIFRSVMRSGIGGMKIGEGVNVKCLHLQAASFIAIGSHPAGEWLKSKGLCGECTDSICRSLHSTGYSQSLD